MPNLTVNQSSAGVFKLSGDLNRHTIPSINDLPLDALKQSSKQTCVIDMSDIQHVDTAGLAWIINCLKKATNLGLSYELKDLPKTLLNLAKISDVDSFLSVQ